MDFKNLKKKICEQKLRDLCQIFVISNQKKIDRLGYGLKNL